MMLSGIRLARCSQVSRTSVPVCRTILASTSTSRKDLVQTRLSPTSSLPDSRGFTTSQINHAIPHKQGFLDKIPKPKAGMISGMFKKLFKSNSISKLAIKTAGYKLNTQCTQGVDFEEFLKVFDLPDTYYSWFLVTELHVWMMSVRLMVGGIPEGEQVRNFLIEALWVDCDGRVSAIGGIPSSEKKSSLNAIYNEFTAALLIYDLGILGNDKELANAVWRRFFLRDDPDFEKIEILIKYIRRNMALLDSMSLEDLILDCTVKWHKLE